MPLARILTLRPDEVNGLFEQLHQLGFDVEVASPHERNLAPADLEIEFAICDQQQVLGRASAIAAQLQADVVVFPGSLPPTPKSMVFEEAPVALHAPVELQVPDERTEVPEQPGPELEPVVTSAAVEALGEPAQRIAWSVKFAEGLRKSRRQIGAAAAVLATRLHSGFVRLRPALANLIMKFKDTTSAAGSAFADRTREYQERMKTRAAQAQALRAQRLAEMERLRLEAREQVVALERVRMAAEAEHQNLQRLDAEQPVREREVKDARPQILQLRGVFAGAAAAAALFIVGILLANFHARAPLPPTLTGGSVQQQVPFGPATVKGAPGVTLSPGVPKSLAETARAARPASATAPPSVRKPEPAVRITRTAAQDPGWRHFRKRSSGEHDDGTADDVVVRHFAPLRKPVTQTAQRQAGIKRYSDE